MAKSKDNAQRDTKGKVTFVMFQVEGDDETLQQGFHAMEQAFHRLGPPARSHTPLPGSVHLLSRAERHVDAPAAGDEEELAVSPEQTEEAASEAEAQGSKAARKYTQPKFLSDLELTSDKESFKDYATKRDPKTDSQKYLVVSRWLQQFKNVDTITIDHIFTCFQAMKWTSQRDVSQPLRLMMKNDSYYQKNGKGWKLTHVGGDAADAIGS
jgi:hypothetical protein